MNEKFIINIGRELGSGGKAIGERLAKIYNIHVYDKKLITLAAEESGICQKFFEKADESNKGFISSLMGGLRIPFISDGAAYDNYLSNDALFKIQSDVIRKLANEESCIFIGRCADYILRDHPRCVNIFVTADMKDRICRLRETNPNISAEDAEISSRRLTRSAPATTTTTATRLGELPPRTTSASTPPSSVLTARRNTSRHSLTRNCN